jgi:hypothetical protein
MADVNYKLISQQQQYVATVSPEHRINLDIVNSLNLLHDLETLFSSLDQHHLANLSILGFPFCELGYRDLTLTYKLGVDDLRKPNPQVLELISNQVKASIWLLVMLLLDASRISELCFAMSFYTGSLVFQFFAKRTGRVFRSFEPVAIAPENVEASSCLVSINESPVAFTTLTSPHFLAGLKNKPLGHQAQSFCTSYLQRRISGNDTHSYSPQNESTPETLHLQEWIDAQKLKGSIIIAIFTSSLDESTYMQLAYEHESCDLEHLHAPAFVSQEEWLLSTLNYLVGRHSDVSVIVRVHPRMGKDARGLGSSPRYESLKKHLITLSQEASNVYVVHPEDKVSSYSIGHDSDLILNAWSTIGLELAMLGKHVMHAFFKCTYGSGTFYPIHLASKPLEDPGDYFFRVEILIRELLESGCVNSLHYLIGKHEAALSLLLSRFYGVVDLNDSMQLLSQIVNPALLTPLAASLIYD